MHDQLLVLTCTRRACLFFTQCTSTSPAVLVLDNALRRHHAMCTLTIHTVVDTIQAATNTPMAGPLLAVACDNKSTGVRCCALSLQSPICTPFTSTGPKTCHFAHRRPPR
ncbi:uncharacterized protein LAESUDRAFT_725038 [Laetiporus sulphureus 93-53]|uniref:Uncharacterized protein n=1 Tax=Laetiporus sulphureus 93-53 TaxID=1314785 RepID=A0A165EQX2_9APHY|nr:uncharacterized protein LAESUDRAFT_732969 [Laetiporus sulphureus 93-53]XP_040765313.1 uncharacterized protein LAESUDRAFT_725038 [Laetiporus sulphureus 93-53]KZS99689.1 hypothetical protein LAESUDRAFT_732969 [Laetiporus sulphureus 93-53]KZT07573.1 hypothetical protein LAESUDRAFT_725038 [Laetiporus sulphureus 93-53]